MAVPGDFIEANTLMLSTYAAIAVQLTGSEGEEALAQLTAIMAGVIPPERVSEFFEFGYAKADMLDASAKQAFADVGAFATMNGFYGLGVNGRGMAMQQVLRGEALAEGVEAPEPSSKYSASAPAFALGPVPTQD